MIISIIVVNIIIAILFITIVIKINFKLIKTLFKDMIRHDSCHHQFTEVNHLFCLLTFHQYYIINLVQMGVFKKSVYR